MLSGLTYNVFLGTTLKSLLKWLYAKNELLDFYCFQEFPEHKVPALRVYLDELGYDFQFTSGFVRYGIAYGELTAFKRTTLKLLRVETISLGGKGERIVVFTHNGFKFFRIDEMQVDKSALLTTFQYQHQQVTLINTHLSSDLHNSRKLKQLAIILDASSTTQPTLIIGDFNYAFGKRKLTRIMDGYEFESGLKRQKTFRFAPGISWQNDYIFQRGCEVKETSTKQVSYSDHYPVFFKVALPE